MADDSVASGRRNAKGQFTKGSNVPAEGGGTDEKVLSALAGINSSIMNSVSINTKTFQRVTNLYDETKNQSTIMKDIADGIAKMMEGSQPSARETATKGLSEDSKPSGDGGDEGKVQKEASKEVSKGFKGFFGRFLKIFGLLSIGAFFKDEISGFIKGAFGQLKTFVADWWAGVLPELQNFGKALLGDRFYEFLFGKEGEKGLFSTAADEIGKFYTANIKPLFDKIANSEMFKSFMGYVEGLGKALKGVGVAMGIINDDGTLTSGGVLTGIAAFSAIFAVGGPMALLQTALLPIKLITGAFGILASIGKGLAGIAWTAVSKGFGAIVSMGASAANAGGNLFRGGALKGLGGFLKSGLAKGGVLLKALIPALPLILLAAGVAGAIAGLVALADARREKLDKQDKTSGEQDPDVARKAAEKQQVTRAITSDTSFEDYDTKDKTTEQLKSEINARVAAGKEDEQKANQLIKKLEDETSRIGGKAKRLVYLSQLKALPMLNKLNSMGLLKSADGSIGDALGAMREDIIKRGPENVQLIDEQYLKKFGISISDKKISTVDVFKGKFDKSKMLGEVQTGKFDFKSKFGETGGLTGFMQDYGKGKQLENAAKNDPRLRAQADFTVNQEALTAAIGAIKNQGAEAKNKALEGAQKKNRELEGDGGVAGDTIIMNGAGDRGATATQQGPGGQTKITAQLAPTKMRRDASGKFVYGAAAGL